MPGEPLLCVWQVAALEECADQHLSPATAEALSNCPSLNLSRSYMEELQITNDTFEDFKADILQNIPPDLPLPFVISQIENACFDVCKTYFKCSTMSSKALAHVWRIFNRLLYLGCPPTISKEAFQWFLQAMKAVLPDLCVEEIIKKLKKEKLTFQECLEFLEITVLLKYPVHTMEQCFAELHTWLVDDIIQAGWLSVRYRKNSNWSSWTDQWAVITPCAVSFYANQAANDCQARVFMTAEGPLIEFYQKKASLFQSELVNFIKISSEPDLDVECRISNKDTCILWKNAFKVAEDYRVKQTTPVQRLLQRRFSSLNDVSTSKENKQGFSRSESLVPSVKPLVNVHVKLCRKSDKMIDVDNADKKLLSKLIVVRSISSDSSDQNSPLPKDSGTFLLDSTEVTFRDAQAMLKEKLKVIFLGADTNGDGYIDRAEFSSYFSGLGLSLTQEELAAYFDQIAKENSEKLTLDEFAAFIMAYYDDGKLPATIAHKAFLQADKDGNGELDFKEFTEFVMERSRSIRVSKLLHGFNSMGGNSELDYDAFKNLLLRQSLLPVDSFATTNEEKLGLVLNKAVTKADTLDTVQFIHNRWQKFKSFRREDAEGNLLMAGGHGMVADRLPGEYSLLNLAMFSDLPPLVPKHTVVRGVKWVTSTQLGKSGQLIFPINFNGVIVTEVATTELLRYYGCCFAERNQEKVALLYRHGIQDFTYHNEYLEKYAKNVNGGSGVERHEFAHLDCPLDKDNGIFILGKMIGSDEIHLTGFSVPIRHTLYIPSGTIHSNDYLRGTWRTMLSDGPIDHVHLVKEMRESPYAVHFNFTFS